MPDNFLKALEKKSEEEKRYHKSQFQYDEGNDIGISTRREVVCYAFLRWAGA